MYDTDDNDGRARDSYEYDRDLFEDSPSVGWREMQRIMGVGA